MKVLPCMLAVLVALSLAGCSRSGNGSAQPNPTPAPSQGKETPSRAPTGEHELDALRGNHWSAATLTLAVGDTVLVKDRDPDVPHNFTVRGVGHSPTLTSGDTFRLRFDKAGTFAFQCTFHADSGMVGTITIR